MLDHERALQRLLPAAAAKNVEIVVGGPYSSGVLAGGAHFEYQKASPEILAKVERIKAIAARHNVSVKAAALQFLLANPVVAAVIPGASKPERIEEDHAAVKEVIPADFWRELREQGLVAANASIRIPVSPDKVWQLIGGFDSLPDWLPYIPSSELSEGGRVRRLATPAGDVIVERLEAFDNRARSYTYSILEAPFPVTGYRSTLQVRESERGGCVAGRLER